MTEHREIDQGRPFDWGRASGDYARYCDIYPQAFYDRLLAQGLWSASRRSASTCSTTPPSPCWRCGNE